MYPYDSDEVRESKNKEYNKFYSDIDRFEDESVYINYGLFFKNGQIIKDIHDNKYYVLFIDKNFYKRGNFKFDYIGYYVTDDNIISHKHISPYHIEPVCEKDNYDEVFNEISSYLKDESDEVKVLEILRERSMKNDKIKVNLLKATDVEEIMF